MFRLRFLAFALLACAGAAQAQSSADAWPSKPIRVLYPFAAGGVGETSLRLIAPAVEAKLGQRFVIESRPGAAGNIAAQEAARAAPDGHTLLIASTSVLSVNPHLFKNLGFDPVGSFDPITTYSESAPVVFINASVPARTLKEFMAYARANPGKLNFGSPGVGSPSHLVSELLSQLTNAAMTHVPYKGTPPMVQGILANDVQMISTTYSAAIGHVKTGKLRVLAATSRERLPDAPDVPTARESGFPELTASNWWGLVAPKGTPPRILERLSAETRTALADPATRKRMIDMSMAPLGSTPAEFASLIKEELGRWKTVVQRGGIKAE
jgi:tripartite-type tricarboxylate transporter receptor subunit TctC